MKNNILVFVCFFSIFCFSQQKGKNIAHINQTTDLFTLLKSDTIINLSKIDYNDEKNKIVVLYSITEMPNDKFFLKISSHEYKYFKKSNLLNLDHLYYEYIKEKNRYYVFASISYNSFYQKIKSVKKNIFKNSRKENDVYSEVLDGDGGEIRLLTISKDTVTDYGTIPYQYYYPYLEDFKYYEEILDINIE